LSKCENKLLIGATKRTLQIFTVPSFTMTDK